MIPKLLQTEVELLLARIEELEKENNELKADKDTYYKETWEHIKRLEKENGELREYLSNGVSRVKK